MKKRHTPEQFVRMLREAEAKLAAGRARSQRPPGNSVSARLRFPPLESSLGHDELT
jgi:hypothetical protein